MGEAITPPGNARTHAPCKMRTRSSITVQTARPKVARRACPSDQRPHILSSTATRTRNLSTVMRITHHYPPSATLVSLYVDPSSLATRFHSSHPPSQPPFLHHQRHRPTPTPTRAPPHAKRPTKRGTPRSRSSMRRLRTLVRFGAGRWSVGL